MNQIGNSFSSIEQVTSQYLQHDTKKASDTTSQTSFESYLQQKLSATESSNTCSELKFSKHASMRLDDRNITLSEDQSNRLEAGVMKANEKGIQDSLVLVDSLAFIVNVPSQTVVTAMDQKESNDSIYTNIDGAVIA